MTKKIIFVCVVVVVIGVSLFFYLTRPAASPSTDIGTATQGDQLQHTDTQPTQTATVYRISQTNSTARFEVGEVLRGSPFTAVGTTNQIAGDIEVNTSNPSASKLGVMKVNARTLKTDSTQRDGAIARFILKSNEDANEFITFAPTSLLGMPAKIESGVAVPFTIAGTLTIKGITKPATFTGTFTLGADGGLTGSARASVKRSDFDLVIPNVPFVASVDENVTVKIDIVASKV